jgi:transcriptional regulator with XRE-family HTH domain
MDDSRNHSLQKVSFGDHLANARTRLNLSQEMLAEAVGVTARTISRWEHNQSDPQRQLLERLCSILQIPPEALLGEYAPAELSPSPSFHYVHYPRNPFFTGRDDLLLYIQEAFHSGAYQLALTGLGGFGKTQTALEYAYRFGDQYRAIFLDSGRNPRILDERLPHACSTFPSPRSR